MFEKICYMEGVPKNFEEEEQIRLLKELRLGNEEAGEKLIVHNLSLVFYEANKIYCSYVELEDRIAIGVIGLMKAISSFDLSRKIKFSTFARTCIDNEIFMLLRRERKEFSNRGLSFDDVVCENEFGRDLSYGETLEDEKSDFIWDYLEGEERELVRKLVSTLPDKERIIIMLYFGFDGPCYNQTQIGEIVGLSQSVVSRKILAIVCKLKLQIEEEYNLEKGKVKRIHL